MHTCPVKDCPITLPDHLLMCRSHWRMVPGELQTAVWRAYRLKDQSAALERAHRMVCKVAVEAVNAALAKHTEPRLAGI